MNQLPVPKLGNRDLGLPGTWNSASKGNVAISSMDANHLENTYNMLGRCLEDVVDDATYDEFENQDSASWVLIRKISQKRSELKAELEDRKNRPKHPVPFHIDAHHLPPELAAQILEREAKLQADPLNEAEREFLIMLAEECGEVVQRITKILRFGYTVNPWTGKDNRVQLECELGDIMAMIRILDARGSVCFATISDWADAKIAALRVRDGRLRHGEVPDGI